MSFRFGQMRLNRLRKVCEVRKGLLGRGLNPYKNDKGMLGLFSTFVAAQTVPQREDFLGVLRVGHILPVQPASDFQSFARCSRARHAR